MAEEFDPNKPDIDNSIMGGIDMFELQVRRRYENPEDAKAIWSFADRIAQMLHEDVKGLASEKGDPNWSTFRGFVEKTDIDQDLHYALQARLAWHLTPSFRDASHRCWELAAVVLSATPPDAVKRFLARVTRCYLLDFVPECLVMCRGALENAVNARYRTEEIPFPVDGRGNPTMKVRLEHADKRGWLNGVPPAKLHAEVWIRGSKAAHGDPSAVGNALGSIQLTMQALTGLNPPTLQE